MERRPVAARRPGKRRLAAAAAAPLVQLHIELRRVEPPVWRRFQVPELLTLAKLHAVLQIVMGWTNSHLHEFNIAGQRYGIPDDEGFDDLPMIDERRARLAQFTGSGLKRFTYTYDFGDSWDHDLRVEQRLARDPATPPIICLDGGNRCPPEDVGGSYGYAEFLKVLRNPRHEEYADMVTWAGGVFDPTTFAIDAVNRQLANIKT